MKCDSMKSDFPLHTAECAPEASRALLVQVQQKFGMTPNLFRVMATSPAMLQAYLATSEAFTNSSLTPVEQQVVLISTSVTNGCTYCVAAHSVIAEMTGVPASVTNAMRDSTVIADTKLEALRKFTQHLVDKRGYVECETTRANFYAAGYNSQSLLDVITGIGLKTMSNYMNHIAATPLDEAFSAAQWKK